MLSPKDTCLIVCSYAAGCCTAGYYLAIWRIGTDIRTLGSGSVGASNVGRSLGAAGFAVTFLFDFAKGLAVVAAARLLHAGTAAATACVIAVVVGHIWPLQLRFHGGKGIATSLGALCVYSWPTVLVLLCLFAPTLLITRRFVLSGMAAFAIAPVYVVLLHHTQADLTAISILAPLILFAHRRNIRDEINRFRHESGEVCDKQAAAGPIDQ